MAASLEHDVYAEVKGRRRKDRMRRRQSHSGLTVNEELWLTSTVSYCDFLLIVPSLKVRGEGVFTKELEEDMRYMMELPGIQTSPVSE